LNLKNPDGYLASELFQEPPDPKIYPDYYLEVSSFQQETRFFFYAKLTSLS
jgi:hypothetical protein